MHGSFALTGRALNRNASSSALYFKFVSLLHTVLYVNAPLWLESNISICVFFIVSGCRRLFTVVGGCDQDLKMFSLQDSSQKGAIMLDIGFVPPQFPASLSHKATWRPFDSFRFNMQWFIILCYSTIRELSVKLYGCPSKTASTLERLCNISMCIYMF